MSLKKAIKIDVNTEFSNYIAMIAYKRILNFENYQIGTDGSIWSLRASVPKRLKPQVKLMGTLQ